MSKTTTVNAIPYPEDTDAPDGPAQIKALAELLDTLKWGSRNLKPTVGVATASSTLTLGTSYADVTGMGFEITPAVASNLVVVAIFDFFVFNSAAFEAEMRGTIKVDSETEETNTAQCYAAIGGVGIIENTVSQVYVKSLTAAKHTIQARAKYAAPLGGAGTRECKKTNSRLLYALFAS